jgi:hypothetical protein
VIFLQINFFYFLFIFMISFFTRTAFVLFFSLALTGCGMSANREESTASPSASISPEASDQVVSESPSSSPTAFASAEIVETVKNLLDKGEEIPQDIERAFLEHGAESVVNILLNTTQVDPTEVEKEIEEIYLLFQNFPLAYVEMTTLPLDPREFLAAKKEERKMCFSVERLAALPNNPAIQPEVLYTIQKGNGCDQVISTPEESPSLSISPSEVKPSSSIKEIPITSPTVKILD